MEAWEKSREQEEALWDETEDERPAPYLPTFLRMDRGLYRKGFHHRGDRRTLRKAEL